MNRKSQIKSQCASRGGDIQQVETKAEDESRAAFSEGELDAAASLTPQQQEELKRFSWPSDATRQQIAKRMETAKCIKYPHSQKLRPWN